MKRFQRTNQHLHTCIHDYWTGTNVAKNKIAALFLCLEYPLAWIIMFIIDPQCL